MIDHAIEKIVEQVMTQGGLLGGLLILALFVIYVLWRKNNSNSAAYEKKLDEVHRERIEELKGVVSSQEKVTTAVNALSVSIDTRTTAFVDLSSNVALLAQSTRDSQDSVKDRLERLERSLDRRQPA